MVSLCEGYAIQMWGGDFGQNNGSRFLVKSKKEMLGICFFTLGVNTLKAPLQKGEKGVVRFLSFSGTTSAFTRPSPMNHPCPVGTVSFTLSVLGLSGGV